MSPADSAMRHAKEGGPLPMVAALKKARVHLILSVWTSLSRNDGGVGSGCFC